MSRFSDAEGRVHHRRWLRAVPHEAELSIYLHIPFCRKICWFCACRTQRADSRAIMDRYLEALRREIHLVRSELPEKVFLARLYLGGGTPTLLTTGRMTALISALDEAFPRTDEFECSVEVDTTQIDAGLVEGLVAKGMTRAVVGVQDFNQRVQAAIGRHQSFEQTLAVVGRLRRAGLRHLDMEMLYGLPAQTAASMAETTQMVLALDPDRVAICEYAHLPDQAKRQVLVDARQLPANEDAFLMSQMARHILLSDGYEAVGMDHFVRPGDSLIAARDKGRLRRDFQGYSDNATHAMIGLGASAISRFPQGYSQNASATSTYIEAVTAGRLPAERGHRLTGTDSAVACMIEMLMCRFRIDVQDMARLHPGSLEAMRRAFDAVTTVFGDFVVRTPRSLTIKPEAHPLTRLIAHVIDQLADADGWR